jgi:hypothetical protein
MRTDQGDKLAEVLRLVSEDSTDVPLIMQRVAEAVLMERERCATIANYYMDPSAIETAIRSGREDGEWSVHERKA